MAPQRKYDIVTGSGSTPSAPDPVQQPGQDTDSGISWGTPPPQAQNQGVSTPPDGGQVSTVDNGGSPDDSGISWGTDPTATSPQHQDAMKINPTDSLPTALAKIPGGVLEGVGQGIFSTAKGVGSLLGLHSDELDKLAGEGDNQSAAAKVGNAGETLTEFLMGDEALKGLSWAEKLQKTAPIAKALQSSPKLMKALQLGVNVGKAGSELGPEEREILKKYPVIARLVGAGYDAVRAGTVQAAQTITKSGDDSVAGLENAGKQGLEMAAGSGAVGGTLGAAGGLLSKGADAASDVADIANDVKTNPVTADDLNQNLSSKVNDTYQPTIDEAQDKLDTSNKTLQDTADSADNKSTIAESATKHVNESKAQLQADFVADGKKLVEKSKGVSIPYKGSSLNEAVNEAAGKAADEKLPLGDAFKVPNPAGPNGKYLLEKLQGAAKGAEDTVNKDDAFWKSWDNNPVVQKVQSGGADLSTSDLLTYRKMVGELRRSTPYLSTADLADHKIYDTVIKGIDNSIGDIVGQTGDDSAKAILDQMNSNYANGMKNLKNPLVDSLLKGKITDVTKKLLSSGQSTPNDIKALRGAIGEDNFNQLAKASLKDFVNDSVDKLTGTINLKSLMTKFKNVPEGVFQSAFGDAGGPELADAIKTASGAQGVLDDTAKTMADVLGNGDLQGLIKNPDRVRALQQAIGPDGMRELGDSVLKNKMLEASTRTARDGSRFVGPIDAGKVLDWWGSLKDSPEIQKALFTPDEKAAQAYSDVMSKMSKIQSVKGAVKAGILAPTILGGAALAAHGGIAAEGALGGLIALMAEQGYRGKQGAESLVESIANNPKMWSGLTKANNAANSGTAHVVAGASRYAGGKVASAIHSVLGGNN